LWSERRTQLKEERAAELEARNIEVAGKTLRWEERVFGEAPTNGYSLWISMHGGGNAPARLNHRQWTNQMSLYQPAEGICVAPRAPTDTWNLWHEAHIDPMFDRLIEDYVALRGVNPCRVYILGYSAGGDGVWQLAPRMADRWAAAAMMAGHPNEASLLSLRNLPFALFVGGNDAAYGRNKVVAARAAELDAAFHDHFSGVANRYADFRPRYPEALLDYLATLVPKNSGVWDCACGNGQASLDLAARFGKVIATDASKEQISSAAACPGIEYRVAPAEQSGLPDKSVALVTVAQALHWFDFDCFYAEVKRVLMPDGVIAVWAYGINTVEDDAVNCLVQDFYSNTVGPYWPPERKLVEEGYRTIPFPFAEIAPPVFRMEARWTLEQLLGYFSTWSATNRCIKATGRNPLGPLGVELSRAWGNADSPRQITWPLTLRIGKQPATKD
jgi:ubiquinone/menaquinone biosynthesis C-methylase UbiE